MNHFPTLPTLAAAPLDQVLYLWAGLGYYARARHLHRSAQKVMAEFGGEFPRDRTTLESLPGIGRSTAAAICAIAYGQAEPILDGNVKRVLTRYQGITADIKQPAVVEQLWKTAEKLMPPQRTADYTQAMMDLGATLCTRSRPACTRCPLQAQCQAHQQGLVEQIPFSQRRKALPVKTTWMLLLCNEQQEVLIEQRPAKGIWGGLWSVPEVSDESAMAAVIKTVGRRLSIKHWPAFRHTFTHYHLDISPVLVHIKPNLSAQKKQHWYKLGAPNNRGFAKPVQQLLNQLKETLL